MFPHLKIPKIFACGALQKASPVCILLFKFEKLWEKIVRVRIARTERISMVSGYSVGRRFPRSVPVPNHIALPGPCRFVFHIEVWSKGRQSHAGWVILESPFRGVCQNSIWNKSTKSNTSGASSFHELFLYLIIFHAWVVSFFQADAPQAEGKTFSSFYSINPYPCVSFCPLVLEQCYILQKSPLFRSIWKQGVNPRIWVDGSGKSTVLKPHVTGI